MTDDPRKTTRRFVPHPAAEPDLPSRMAPREREMDELRRRLESEIDRRVTDLSASVQHYVQTAVKLAVHPLEQQLSLLVSRVESDRQGREEYRLKRERDEAEVAKERAETHALIVSAQLAPGEARNRYRTALLATLGTIVVALIALASAAIASHR